MRRFLIGTCIFSASLVLVAESKGQPPWPPWDWRYGPHTSVNGFIVRLPPNGSSARTSNSRNRSSSRPSPARSAQPKVTSDREFFAPNLQIHFKLVRLGGVIGARLTRAPSSSSPTLHVLVNGSPVYLEPNDVIYSLDSLPIREVADVLNHHSQTTITFVDHRTGRTFNGVLTLPAYAQTSYARRQ